ncbi:DUF3095 domain-containing protein [Leptospira perolatii]|uniref:DUF3095 domain-containing protein n=1 Tax=Leptospira perolatii TaxID=2023191 RepID=UPI001FAF918E|nr:DUF3095 domain-containing protein [Leptospira perolatii]
MNFYKSLPEIQNFLEVTDSTKLNPVPKDWLVVVTDIVNSTRAISEGRYKDVNIAGGLTLMGISNLLKDMEYPFFFGGDGVTILLPGEKEKPIREVLADTRNFVKQYFNLDLRVGIVPVREIYDQSHDLSLGKVRISEYYTQAILSGSGSEFAEVEIKKPNSRYLLGEEIIVETPADFSGFTCRWKDIPSPKEETVSLIVRLAEGKQTKMLSELLSFFNSVYGSEIDYHPLRVENLSVESSPKKLIKEAVASSKGNWLLSKLLLWKIRFEVWGANLAMKWNLPIKVFHYKLNKLKDYQVISSDYRKFDGTFKMVFASATGDRVKLEAFLEEAEKKGSLFFGIHVSDRALITCLLHAGSEKEVHFVDGADGGYALAAKMLKAKLFS